MNVFKTSLLATALIAAGAVAPANAADNMNFDVTLSIDESCDVISTETVAFGVQLASAGTATAQGDVAVQCTVDTAYELALNAGTHSGNDITARQMQINAGTATIAYQLYHDSANSDVWGETTGIGGDTATGIGTGFGDATFNQVHTVYAEATIVGTEPTGDYSDTITATVTF